MLKINKEKFDELIHQKKYIDAAVLLVLEYVSKEVDIEKLNHAYVIGVCHNQLSFALENMDEEKIINTCLNVNSEFFKKQVIIITLMIQLNIINYELIDGGIAIYDTRSTLATAILEVYNSLNIINSKKDPNISLIEDLFSKMINQSLGIVKMLNLGLVSEAFGSWRTLHESICITKILIDGKEEVKNSYIKHIIYSNAFRGAIQNDEERDRIFNEMKEEMKEHNLKSKDMKKFIEYGWLYSYKNFDQNDPTYKLNFRDGVQRCAELRDYSEWYEAASELSHSSAIFFYSQGEYFLNLTIHGFYDMLLLLDEIFYSYYEDVINRMPQQFITNLSYLRNEVKEMAEKQESVFNKKYFGIEDGN